MFQGVTIYGGENQADLYRTMLSSDLGALTRAINASPEWELIGPVQIAEIPFSGANPASATYVATLGRLFGPVTRSSNNG